jgi:hypothetical protein
VALLRDFLLENLKIVEDTARPPISERAVKLEAGKASTRRAKSA